MKKTLCLLIILLSHSVEAKTVPTIKQSVFGHLDDGREVQLYTLDNGRGMSLEIMNLGAVIVSLKVPDSAGKIDDIVLGFDTPQHYLTDSPYFGAIVGRYANRIAKGSFILNGKQYRLYTNNGENHLHGGKIGFDKRLWQAESVSDKKGVGLKLSLFSKDGDEGYPGNLKLSVLYRLDQDNRLSVEYRASSDADTVLNVSQHSYFNLEGHDSGNISSHRLMLNADHYTPVNDQLIPSGEIAAVDDTPMDFRILKPIANGINSQFQQILYGKGYDHNWVLNKRAEPGELELAAHVIAAESGRQLKVYTDQPGVQFYAGNFLDGSIKGKAGVSYQYRGGFCLETQHFPDSPNQVNFPSTVLKAGEDFYSQTVFEFSSQ